MHYPTLRLLAALVLAVWLIGGLVLTLQPAHPLPGQVVHDNIVPFRTLRIYLDNLGSEFWMRNLFGNLALLLPLGLLGPIAPRPGPMVAHRPRGAPLLSRHRAHPARGPDRSTDIDDVIVNHTGALLGFGFLKTFGLFRAVA